MSDHLTIITNRRSEVLKIVAEAKKAQDAGEAELAELDVTGRTLARLTGASWPPDGESDAEVAPPPPSPRTSQFEVPVTEMILTVMREEPLKSYGDMVGGVAPKEVKPEISRRFGKDVRGEYVSTTMWRLAERELLKKLGDGRYQLPDSNPEKDRATEPAKL